jgi:ferric-dicitrate binding protein FerR (iron transport regulator)
MEHRDQKEEQSLLRKYLFGTLSVPEMDALNLWANLSVANQAVLTELETTRAKEVLDILQEYPIEEQWVLFQGQLAAASRTTTLRKRSIYWLAAATILLASGLGVYWLAREANTKSVVQTDTVSYRTIAIPRGKQGFVQLPDSSRVWLNAASTLRYPEHFSDSVRSVELEGEAFFDVTKARVPFTVKLKDMEVAVRGTRFNVKSYEGESRTSLLEGSVEVSSGSQIRHLKPGEQAILNPLGTFIVSEADTSAIKSWISGREYSFQEIALPDLLKDLERVYDIEIDFNISDLAGSEIINGEIPKSATIKQISQILGPLYPKFSFIPSEKKLIVKKKK